MKAHFIFKDVPRTIVVISFAGNKLQGSSNNFFVPDHEAPSLVSVTPANGETAEENNTILLNF